MYMCAVTCITAFPKEWWSDVALLYFRKRSFDVAKKDVGNGMKSFDRQNYMYHTTFVFWGTPG